MVDIKIDPKDIPWNNIKKGLRNKVLFNDLEKDLGVHITECAPGFISPFHDHPNDEWVYILKGSMSDESGEYKVGEFIINKKGSSHTVHAGPNGCTLIVISPGFPYK